MDQNINSSNSGEASNAPFPAPQHVEIPTSSVKVALLGTQTLEHADSPLQTPAPGEPENRPVEDDDALVDGISESGMSSQGTETLQTDLPDDEILDDRSALKGLPLLQLASTRTNVEIADRVNELHGRHVLSADAVERRIVHALTQVAKEYGKTRDDLKHQLQAIRRRNGAYKSNRNTRRAGKKEVFQISDENDAPEREETTTTTIDTAGIDPGLLAQCMDILNGKPHLLVLDAVLKVAGVFTTNEIVEQVDAIHGKGTLSFGALSVRLSSALIAIAKRDGKTRDEVAAELNAARTKNGVTKRRYAYGGAKHSEIATKKRVKKAAEEVKMDVEEADVEESAEVDDEDPLGDLEEMVRRTLEGSL